MTSHTSALLINEEPLQVLPSLAVKIGFNEAVVLQQLHYWMRKPKVGVERLGRKWVYNSYPEWQRDNFPFWSLKTVERTFVSLEGMGLVISDTPGGRDRKKWYSIDYDELNKLISEEPQPTHSHPDSEAAPPRQDDVMHAPRMTLSDASNCRDASPQNDVMEDGGLSSPSPQNVVVLNKVAETTSETTREHTHSAPPPPPVCECASTHVSKFCFEERAAHADANGLGEGWLNNSRDGRYDDLIERARRRRTPEAVESSLRDTRRPHVSFREAMLHVKSVLDVNPDTDFEGLILSLDLDDQVRAQLREKAPALRPRARASPRHL